MAEITVPTPEAPADGDRDEPPAPLDDRARRSLRLYGAVAGLAAAFAALAVAELVAGTRSDLQSPVLDVGDRVVDAVPRPVQDLAIDWFGTKDKVALLAGIGTLLAIYALIVGTIAVGRRWRFAIVGVAAFGLIGAYTSQTTRRATEWYAVLPSLTGGAAGAAVLVLLRRQLIRPVPNAAPSDAPVGASNWPAHVDRRRFVIASGATAAGAAAMGATGRRLADRYDLGSQRESLTLPPADRPLAPAPTDVQVVVDGVSPFFTPNGDFYRIDTALTVPRVSVQDWQLEAVLADNDLLTSVLTYHVVAGEGMSSADLIAAGTVETVNGGTLEITDVDGTLTVNGIPTVCMDVPTANATVHIIGGVLLPD